MPLPLDAEFIKASFTSPSSCTSNTTELLTNLLNGACTKEQSLGTTKAKKPTLKESKTETRSRVIARDNAGSIQKRDQDLKPVERVRLATEVINICLKTLSQEVQARAQDSKPNSPRKLSDKVLTTRSINVPPTPTKSVKNNISNSTGDGIKIVADCARLALASLRKHNDQVKSQGLPALQVESAMSALISKLITLDMIDSACKEVRLLAQRLAMGIEKEATSNGNTRSRPKIIEKQPSLASFLLLKSHPDSSQKLSLVIAAQLHILRLLPLTKSIPDPLVLLDVLNVDSPSSPANLIEVTLATDGKDKCTRQLGTLAHAVLAVSNRIASKITESSDSKSDIAGGILRLRVESLHILWRSWNLAGHKIEFHKQLCQPLRRYIEEYLSLSQAPAVVRLDTVDEIIINVTALAHSITLSKQQRQEFQIASLDFDQILQSLSKSAGNHTKSKRLADQALARLKTVEVSGARKSTILCQAAMTKIQHATSVPQEELCQALEEAVGSYSLSVDGSSEDLDELLVSISGLRKSAINFLSKYKHDATTEIQLWESHMINCVLKTLTFTLRYVGTHSDATKSKNALSRYEKRRSLAAKIARGTIESVVALAKGATQHTSRDWKDYEQPLEDCLVLAERLDLENVDNVSEMKKAHTPVRILVSNAYWCRYLALRQSSSKNTTLAALLERSTRLLEDLSSAQQKAGLLANKLERLAYVYEQSKDWIKATDAYQKALSHLIDSGSVQLMAEKLQWVPIINAILEDPGIKVIGKVIEGCCRVQKDVDSIASELLVVQNLTPVLHGLVLELQLACMTRYYHADPNHSLIANAIEKLGRDLLQIYTEDEFPIRRLRAISSLAECNYVLDQQPDTGDNCTELSLSERVLLPFHDHLIARRNAVFAIRQMRHSKLLTTALSQWVTLIGHESITSWQALVNRIGDVRGWHDLLNTIACFTEAHGLLEQRIASLDLLAYTLQLSASFDTGAFVLRTSSLVTELVGLGFVTDALVLLSQNRKLISDARSTEEDLYHWNAAQAEYCLATNNKSGIKAATLAIKEFTASHFRDPLLSRAQVHYLSAKHEYILGRLSKSIFHIKQSVRHYFQAWAITERKQGALTSSNSISSINENKSVLESDLGEHSVSFDSSNTANIAVDTPPFWPILRPLFESLIYASMIHLQTGLVAEGRYYVLEALRIAESTSASAFIARALTLQADLETRSGNVILGKSLYDKVRQLLQSTSHIGGTQFTMLQAECAVYWARQDGYELQELDELCGKINEIKTPRLLLPRTLELETEQLVKQLSKLQIAQNQHKAPIATTKSTNSTMQPSKVSNLSCLPVPDREICPIEQLKRRLLQTKASILLKNADDPQALASADEIVQLLSSDDVTLQQTQLSCSIHLKRGFQALQLSPILNIVPEAILAQPTVMSIRPPTTTLEHVRVSKKPKATMAKRKQLEANDCSVHFRLAAACCFPLQSATTGWYDITSIHSLSDLSLKSFLTLAAAAPSSQGIETPISHLPRHLELGRNYAWVGIKAAIEADSLISDANDLKMGSQSDDMDVVAPNLDHFQSEYVDIIPLDWHVVSLSLSEDRKELRLGAFRSGASPFILSIPLNRESRDGNDNEFTFDQGKKELLRFIGLANYSTHESIDLTKKGAKAEWWEARAALDSRLQDLLTNMENMWLGGFKSILMHCHTDHELIVEFEKSFIKTLDKHLPSRQSKKARKEAPVILVQHISELFLRLGSLSDDRNIEESILDLLYFVVDTLWFNGEKNACDEIDFDPMVLEIQDAITSYHEAIKLNNEDISPGHTILILDKRLHAFPWESLPCMRGKSVSRLPSLQSLRERILQMHEQQKNSSSTHLTVDKSDGSFILNPSGDLKNTQACFEEPLSRLETWTSKINAIPDETELSTALSTRSLYLYFGHGSGGQYIRSRTIRRLDRCAVALLMGCSSGTSTEAGDFESYGTPLNYLHAGAPAVVGTLWDVTDKDIDRFSTKMLERWGLFDGDNIEVKKRQASPMKRSTKGKGRQKQKDDEASSSEQRPPVGLDTAVAEARESCIMRYLNGAAPVVYGIPVFLR